MKTKTGNWKKNDKMNEIKKFRNNKKKREFLAPINTRSRDSDWPVNREVPL